MPATLVLTSTPAEIERGFIREAARTLDGVLRRAAPRIRSRAGDLARTLIADAEEYRSLLAGRLRGHMGLEDPETVLRAILDAVAGSVSATVDPPRPAGRGIEGGIDLGILMSDFSDVLGAAGASYVSPPSGRAVDWLDWMLTQGDRVVVYNYSITFSMNGRDAGASRSGAALMFPNPGKGWRVPGWASGVASDNWLTRAFDVSGLERSLAEIMRREIEEAVR